MRSILRRAGHLRRACRSGALAIGSLAIFVAVPAAVAQPWGRTGADYTGGIVCQLPGTTSGSTTTVLMATWSVDGVHTFAVDDVFRDGTSDSPAPAPQASQPATGPGGVGADSAATAAYLTSRVDPRDAAAVAEVSADVAALSGGGSRQRACLGQQGTSVVNAGHLLAAARRLAGPYRIEVQARARAAVGHPIEATATVSAASGAHVPGVVVTFAPAGGAATNTAVTGARGQAETTLPAGPAVSRVTASVAEPVSLASYATDPITVAAGPPVVVRAVAAVTPATPPHPTVTVTSTAALVASGGQVGLTARVQGTNGYSGTGTATLLGPVITPKDGSCAQLDSKDFAGATAGWSQSFVANGDVDAVLGPARALSPGCYLPQVGYTTTDSNPAASVRSAFAANDVLIVSPVSVDYGVVEQVVPMGALSEQVTASHAASASVSSTVTAYGPLATHGSGCTGVDWSQAEPAATSQPVSLRAAPGGDFRPARDSLVARIATVPVSRVGCYSLHTTSVVVQEGHQVSVRSPAATDPTVLVVDPHLTVSDATYAGLRGRAMTGDVSVVGTQGLAGRVRIGLVTGKPSIAGCRDVVFDRSPEARTTTVTTSGDGDFRFRTPTPTDNRCYGVTAVLSLDANPAVRSAAPPPSADSTFLAGVRLNSTDQPTVGPSPDPGRRRSLIGLAVPATLILLLATMIITRFAVRRRPSGPAAGSRVDLLGAAAGQDSDSSRSPSEAMSSLLTE